MTGRAGSSRPAALAGLLLLATACNVTEQSVPGPPPPPPPPPFELLLSNAMTIPPGAQGSSSGHASATGEELVFLSLSPGAALDGRTIRARVNRTGAVFDATLVDGGLDPIAVFASAGDTLDITLTRTSGSVVSFRAAVPPRKPPVVVRTEPKKNRRDVPLNASIQVVFTEPITAGSLEPQNISMRIGGQPVPGRALFVNAEHTIVGLVPDQPLRNGVDYELIVGTGVLDRDGSALEGGTVVSFTTVSATGSEPGGSGPFVISEPVGGSAWISMPSRTWPIGGGALTVTIAVRGSEAEITKPMLMEGLDPVAFPAATGDTVTASVQGFAGLLSEYVFLVPLSWPPAVIRVSPEPGDSQAAVSQPIRVVFSEPIMAASLTQGAITLLRGGEPIAAELRFADPDHTVVEVVPGQPLAGGTLYELLIGSGIRDTGAQPLPAPVRVGFRTAAMLPGGTQLAFVRDGQIFLVGSDGTGLVQLTNTGPGIVNGGPAWSPDGHRLAFMRSEESGYDIYVMDADGGNLTRRTFGGYNVEPAWSPDGSRIAFTRLEEGSAGIFLIDASGPAVIRQVINRPGYDAAPAWSPDGSRISFTSDWRAYDFVYDLYVVNPDGSNVQTLLESPFFASPATYYLSSAWSPDGSRIAVTACFNWSYWTCYPESGVALVNPDGSGFRVIARTTSGSYGWPTWSPDGQTIAFAASECPEGCGTSLRWVRADGSSRGLIITNGTSPAWRPTP